MIYLQTSSRKRGIFNSPKYFWISIFVIIVISASIFSFIPSVFRVLGIYSFSTSGIVKDLFKSIFPVLYSKHSLIQENIILKQTLNEKDSLIASLSFLKSENDILKQHLGRSSVSSKLALAYIIAGPGKSPYDTLVLDLGKNANIEEGNLIRGVGGIPLGVIKYVYDTFSVAELYSSPGKTIEVRIGEGGSITTAYGKGGGNFQAKLPRESDVSVGDQIVSPSIDNGAFAIVNMIESNPADSYQKVYFKLPVNIFELRFVDIDLKEKYVTEE